MPSDTLRVTSPLSGETAFPTRVHLRYRSDRLDWQRPTAVATRTMLPSASFVLVSCVKLKLDNFWRVLM